MSFVTDQGERYPVPGVAQLAWFGYAAVKPNVPRPFAAARIPRRTGP